MRTLVTLLLFFSAYTGKCCRCDPQLDFKSEKELKNYSFIALVKITDLAPMDITFPGWHMRKDGHIKATTIELFKGIPTEDFNDPGFKSDCALTLNVGEKWLFFAYANDKHIYVSNCSYSTRYQTSGGFRDWQYLTGLERLNSLRKTFGRTVNTNTLNRVYFDNGKTEIDQKFTAGKLDGIRNIYYPDGSLYVSEKFKNGERRGFRRIYLPSGQLIEESRYIEGSIRIKIRYQDTADAARYLTTLAKHQDNILFTDDFHNATYYKNLLDSLRRLKHWEKKISNVLRFYNKGLSYNSISRNYEGTISSIANMDWGLQLYNSVNYKKDGNTQYTTQYNNIFDTSLEIDYRDDGTIKRFKQKCDACKFYFDRNPRNSNPEAVYIQ